jgi:ankyrin repeat protein
MVRTLTPKSSLENLKREAKRWLKALRDNDPEALARLKRANPKAPAQPTLRDVQLALAREFGLSGWDELKSQLSSRANAAATPELTALLEASSKGEAERVGEILDAHPELIDERGVLHGHSGLRTALHFAVHHRDVVRLLLERGADPNIRDEGDDAMPLHFAAERGDMEIVRMLVEHGADAVGDGTMHELNVLGWAICWDYVHNQEVAEYLLAHGAKHTIHTAVALGDVEAIRDIAKRSPADLDRPMDRTNLRRHPIHLAVVKQQPRALETLLDLGADVGARDARGLTALDQAALNGEEQMARVLVDRGAKIDLPAAIALDRAEDVNGLLREDAGALKRGGRWANLIVHVAARSPGAVIERLIRAGADVNVGADPETAVDQAHNYTALHAAAFHGNIDAVEVLLRHDANVRARDSKYCGTPIGWARYANHPQVVKRLLAHAVDIFDAIEFDRPEFIPDILRSDAGALERPFGAYGNCDGAEWLPAKDMTPLEFARRNDKAEAVRILIEHGADTAGIADRPLDQIVDAFLEVACPDHHVRGGSDHAMARATAMRLLAKHPEIASDSFITAVVLGDVETVERMLAENPSLAREKRPVAGRSRDGPANQGDQLRRVPGPKTWEPLLFLCFTRLPLPASNDNALTIARLLLDHGADPNAFFMAGNSRYTPMVGAIGEGEEDRPAHPHRDALVRLLLERGAEPYDMQVGYNMHFNGDALWWLKLIYERSVQTGRKADWDDPEWSMLGMGNYGNGARWYLEAAVRNNDIRLAEWCLAHGADANAAAPARKPTSQISLHEMAVRRSNKEVAVLLERYGAKPSRVEVTDADRFALACYRLDRTAAELLARKHPELLTSTVVLFRATKENRADIVRLLLDLGMSPNVEDTKKQRALHIAGYDDAADVAKLLIDRGAEIDMRESNWNNTPMDCAIYGQSQRMIELLTPHIRDIWNLVTIGHTNRLRELLSEKPERAETVWDGWTPLMALPDDETAAIEIVELFVANGADVTIRNNEGLTAEDYARKRALDGAAALLHAAARSGS